MIPGGEGSEGCQVRLPGRGETVMSETFELTARETRAVRAAVAEARSSGVVDEGEALLKHVEGRLVVDSASLGPICRSLQHVAREIPRHQMRARLGIAGSELEVLFGRVVARWAFLAGF